MNKIVIALLMIFFSSMSLALSIEEPLPDGVHEARARALFQELRCVVCAGETIADSPADVAADMRREVRKQIKNEKTDDEIINYFVSHYGESVRMRPAFGMHTVMLWLSPFLILVIGGLCVVLFFRRRT